MGHHHHVEALVRKIRQTLVEILLDDAEAAAEGVGDVVRIDLDTETIGATLCSRSRDRNSPSPQPRSRTRAPGVIQRRIRVRSWRIR
jgi:hypothetical protein